MFVVRLINTITFYIYQKMMQNFAERKRKASMRAMCRLDAHLLEDIGFRREGDALVPLRSSHDAVTVRNHRRKVRLRCAFLARRGRRAKEDGVA